MPEFVVCVLASHVYCVTLVCITCRLPMTYPYLILLLQFSPWVQSYSLSVLSRENRVCQPLLIAVICFATNKHFAHKFNGFGKFLL